MEELRLYRGIYAACLKIQVFDMVALLRSAHLYNCRIKECIPVRADKKPYRFN